MILDAKSMAALSAARETAPIGKSFTDDSIGVWVGGRVYTDEFDDVIFVPLGSSRSEIGIPRPLRFVGDALKNIRGFQHEVRVVAPVEG